MYALSRTDSAKVLLELGDDSRVGEIKEEAGSSSVALVGGSESSNKQWI